LKEWCFPESSSGQAVIFSNLWSAVPTATVKKIEVVFYWPSGVGKLIDEHQFACQYAFFIARLFYISLITNQKTTMKKDCRLPYALFVCFRLPHTSQLMVAKMVGKDASRYGLGYGLFTYLDFPLANANQSFRIELMDLAFFPSKGENFFTSTAGSKGYISIKLGYKYVFSETQAVSILSLQLVIAGLCLQKKVKRLLTATVMQQHSRVVMHLKWDKKVILSTSD
jgi:hypothetical protein